MILYHVYKNDSTRIATFPTPELARWFIDNYPYESNLVVGVQGQAF